MEGQVSGGEAAFAFSMYLPGLGVLPILVSLAAKPRTRFLRYHATQGLYFFSIFLALFVLLLGLFYVSNNLLHLPVVRNILAVLVVMVLASYVVLAVLMMLSCLAKKMVMLPVLGELAGER